MNESILRRFVAKKYQRPVLLSKRFLNATPFPYIVLKGFLRLNCAKLLKQAIIKENFTHKNADLFSFSQTQDLNGERGKRSIFINDFYKFMSSPELITYISQVTTTKLSSTIDMAGSVYRKGDYLLPHDDRLEGRTIAYILNLSEKFSAKDGGELSFFSSRNSHPTAIAKEIIPSFNTLTLFKVSSTSFHQVNEVLTNKSRISIGGWFHAN